MELGMVGLGRMGANMALRLLAAGHTVVGFDRDAAARDRVAAEGVAVLTSLSELVGALERPRAVWVMVPSGAPTDETIAALAEVLEPGDLVIDGGNSRYDAAAGHAATCAARGVDFCDAGTSGGIWGRENGYCLMVGGAPDAVGRVAPIFTALAPPGGYAHVGPLGAGHFVKMVHNGIEYGLMQAYAEGFALLAAADEFALDLHEIAAIWGEGSVVRSWLLELTERALRPGSGFETVSGVVADSGEGRWTVEEAVARGVPAPVITASLFERFSSRGEGGFANRLLAALRNEFGGHPVVRATPEAER